MPVSSSEQRSSHFELLHESIRHWIWKQGWTSLRDAQEAAIPVLLEGQRDLIIAAATAAGKTEAAFLPILSHLLQSDNPNGTVLYISPLRALINDQWGRLNNLCEHLDIQVTPWHGDISCSKKKKFMKQPRGIVLITPESLEAIFVLRGHQVGGFFRDLRYIVIDELHSFIDSERGKQLQSQLCRLQAHLGHEVPRIGLSATLGDMGLAARFLRPRQPERVEMIVSVSAQQPIKILLKAIENADPLDEDDERMGVLTIADGLYKCLRGSNNLVFPNTRADVEKYCDLLSRRCEREGAPNEFWAHHSSLSKETREATEAALKEGTRPATCLCTSTLEMGIDIGSVKTVAQIGAPPSVASLRQRLGRSGRRPGEAAILRAYQLITPAHDLEGVVENLRPDLLHTIASIQLLLQGWCEPPRLESLHASTLVQQILSVIAERGGATAAQLWKLLVGEGAFQVSRPQFTDLLRELGRRELLMQESSGLLLHGAKGEQCVNHYTFYATFQTDEEYRVITEGRTLGNLSVSNMLLPDSKIILGGKRWCVIEVFHKEKTIVVRPDPGGKPPRFEAHGALAHDRVREQMRLLVSELEPVVFLDETAAEALAAARRFYAELGGRVLVEQGAETCVLTWMGDRVNDALVLLLAQFGVEAMNEGIALTVRAEEERTREVLGQIADWDGEDAALFVLAEVPPLEKWDWALPKELLLASYLSSALDVAGARSWAVSLDSNRIIGHLGSELKTAWTEWVEECGN